MTPDMVEEPHDWHEIAYWQWPLWKCQRCKMQTKALEQASSRPCLPTTRGQCRVCHGPARTKTSLYCRLHRFEWQYKRSLTDDQIVALRESGASLRQIGEQVGVSRERVRQILAEIARQRRWRAR